MLSASQERLSTGLRVNSALDNPTNFFTAQGLRSRASDLSALSDAISNSVQTLAAADKGITAITKLVESAQATARQALQSAVTVGVTAQVTASTSTSDLTSISITGTPGTAASVTMNAFSTVVMTPAVTAEAGTLLGGAFSTLNVSNPGAAAQYAAVTGNGFTTIDLSGGGDSIVLGFEIDNAPTQTITIDATSIADYFTATSQTLNAAALSHTDIANLIDFEAGVNIATATGGGEIMLASLTIGNGSAFVLSAVTENVTSGTAGFFPGSSSTGSDGVPTDAVNFNIRVNSNGPLPIEISANTVATYNSNNSASLDPTALSASDVVAMINDQMGMSIATVDSGAIRLTSNFVGGGSSMWVLGFSQTTTSGSSGLANGLDGGVAGDPGSFAAFDIAVDGNAPVSIRLDAAAVAAYTGPALDTMNLSSSDFAALINQQLGQAVADGSSGSLIFTSPSLGGSSSIAISNISETYYGGPAGIVSASDTGIAATGTAGQFRVNGRAVTLTGGDNITSIVAKLQAAASGSSGTSAFTVSNANGVVSITGTGGNDVVIVGMTANQATALGLSNGTIDGTPAGPGGPNPIRAELVDTYNDLLGQIDTLARDSGFNGINLLGDDDLSVILNDDASSTLDIEGLDNSASGLGLTLLSGTTFNTNASINAALAEAKEALETLRSQAARLGSNLSVVEVRQDFTRSIINVLETGAANLTLADANQEAANVLALQTRQQLGSTALSLASQADQNVLRLF